MLGKVDFFNTRMYSTLVADSSLHASSFCQFEEKRIVISLEDDSFFLVHATVFAFGSTDASSRGAVVLVAYEKINKIVLAKFFSTKIFGFKKDCEYQEFSTTHLGPTSLIICLWLRGVGPACGVTLVVLGFFAAL